MGIKIPLIVERLPYGALPVLDGYGGLACVTFYGARVIEKRQGRHCLQIMHIEEDKPERITERITALGRVLLKKCAFPCAIRLLVSSVYTIEGVFIADFAICCFETVDGYDLCLETSVNLGVKLERYIFTENPELEKAMCVYKVMEE